MASFWALWAHSGHFGAILRSKSQILEAPKSDDLPSKSPDFGGFRSFWGSRESCGLLAGSARFARREFLIFPRSFSLFLPFPRSFSSLFPLVHFHHFSIF